MIGFRHKAAEDIPVTLNMSALFDTWSRRGWTVAAAKLDTCGGGVGQREECHRVGTLRGHGPVGRGRRNPETRASQGKAKERNHHD